MAGWVQVEPLMFYLVFGESVLNDAVSLVLFNIFSKVRGRPRLARHHMQAPEEAVVIMVHRTSLLYSAHAS